jgi:hypothetical protein
MRFLRDLQYVVTDSRDLIALVAIALIGVQLVVMYAAL